jgi:hypothetical protein
MPYALDDSAIKAPLVLTEDEARFLLGESKHIQVQSRPYICPEERSRANSTLSDKSSSLPTAKKKKNQDPIDVSAIISGSEKRTTVTLRNLPRRMSEGELRGYIDSIFGASYDYLYLPPDVSRNKHNRGFAFMNMNSPDAVVHLVEGLSSLPDHVPVRTASVSFTHFQGNRESLESYVKIRRTIRK